VTLKFEKEDVYPERDTSLPSWQTVAEQLAKREGTDKVISAGNAHEYYQRAVRKLRAKLSKDPLVQEYLMSTKVWKGKQDGKAK
jgi:hypothetical protein|tara:strand:- start:5301 stop:5552 length:252 start_codon:yes stop_codon:yes gene_type:complete